jgi:two-component system, NtrC family, sensor kinase
MLNHNNKASGIQSRTLLKALFDCNIKHITKVLVFVIPFVLGIILLLGWMSSKKTKEIVTTDFNQQQLLLAKHAASQIEYHLNSMNKELKFLGLSPSLQYFEKVSIGKRMEITFLSVHEKGVLEIRYIDFTGKRTHVSDANGYHVISTHPDDVPYFNWASQDKNKGAVTMSDVSPSIHKSTYHSLILKTAVPVWQISADTANPLPTNRFSGVLIFVIDTTSMLEKITGSILSGKTGYAWVIDEKGNFLCHPEKEFIGKNAFDARREKRPTISFDRINAIQKDKMMKGEEGMSWYVSGWHRGDRGGELKKLIAYAPVRLNAAPEEPVWSVAVVAPVSEVEDAINSIQVRQLSLEAVIIAVILLGGLSIVYLTLKWSKIMEEEVERKTLELKKSEQKYKSLVENAEDMIFTINKDGKILTINKAGIRFFRRSADELTGLNIGDLCAYEESASLQFRTVDSVFKTGGSKQIVYPVLIAGDERMISTNFSALYDDKGQVFAVLGISRDVTERTKSEEQMYHTEKLASLGTLAAGVAHEINNPLAIILGFTDLLLEKSDSRSDQHDILKTIEKQGNNAKRVVENLLSFARYREPKEEFVDINKNIKEVLEVLENTLSLKRITVEHELYSGLPMVKADPREIQQVFFNIINNAISAMNGKGQLLIKTASREGGDVIEIRLADSGHGIRKEHRSKIFDPLFTTKNVGEGTGLGLSVSYGIVMKYGGSLSFETKTIEETPQTGTTFIIILPSADAMHKQSSEELV